MNQKIVYTYAKFHVQNVIEYYENKLKIEVLNESEEDEINRLLVFYKRELACVKFELSLMA